MQSVYQLCPCGSNKKFKWCCLHQAPDKILTNAANLPATCRADISSISETGLVSVQIERAMLDDRFIFAFFLTDTYCLGLKNTGLWMNLSRQDANALRNRFETRSIRPVNAIDYEDARSIVLGSIDYAGKLGFDPHEEWKQTRYLLEYDRPWDPTFEFGRNGKPCYIPGPDDDMAAVRNKLANVDWDGMQAVPLSMIQF